MWGRGNKVSSRLADLKRAGGEHHPHGPRSLLPF